MSEQGLFLLFAKISAINNIPLPRIKRQLKSCLGMYQYHSKFVSHYAKFLQPLHSLSASSFHSLQIRLQVSDLPVFPHPCLYAVDFNCPHVDWGNDANNTDGECLGGWASTNNLALLYNPKDAASFHPGRRNTTTNPDLAFVNIDSDSRLPDRHVLEKFSRSQDLPSPITPPRFARPVPSKPVKRWNFRKAKWSHYITLTNKLARALPLPDLSDMEQEYQCFCNAISTAAKKCIPGGRPNNRVPCWDAECENLYQTFLYYPKGHDSSRAITALLARLDRKRRD